MDINKSFDFKRIESYEYEGFVLVPSFTPSGKVCSAICEEINFSMYSLNTSPWIEYSSVISLFKKKVDEILENKKVSHSDAEKELARLKLLLFMQPEVFYGTRQVYDLLTLAEDLLAASPKRSSNEAKPKEEKEDPTLKEYHKQLDRLSEWDKSIKYDAEIIQHKLVEIHLLFKGVLEFSLSDVKKHYFERANKE